MGLILCSLSKAKQKGFQSNKNEAKGPFLDHLGCLVGAGLVKQESRGFSSERFKERW